MDFHLFLALQMTTISRRPRLPLRASVAALPSTATPDTASPSPCMCCSRPPQKSDSEQGKYLKGANIKSPDTSKQTGPGQQKHHVSTDHSEQKDDESCQDLPRLQIRRPVRLICLQHGDKADCNEGSGQQECLRDIPAVQLVGPANCDEKQGGEKDPKKQEQVHRIPVGDRQAGCHHTQRHLPKKALDFPKAPFRFVGARQVEDLWGLRTLCLVLGTDCFGPPETGAQKAYWQGQVNERSKQAVFWQKGA